MMTRLLCAGAIVLAAAGAGRAWAVQEPAKKAYILGGHFLARGGRTATLEGPPAKSRVVVIEFPSFDRAKQFYDSPEYVAARKVRAGAATAQFVLVEGQ